VREYHRRAGIYPPNEKLHATLHAIVETQIALKEETPVGRIARRLIGEGLDRHDAIHAIGMVLAEHIYDVLKTTKSDKDPSAPYFDALECQRSPDRASATHCDGVTIRRLAPRFAPPRDGLFGGCRVFPSANISTYWAMRRARVSAFSHPGFDRSPQNGWRCRVQRTSGVPPDWP
jgi:hypothetical protein